MGRIEFARLRPTSRREPPTGAEIEVAAGEEPWSRVELLDLLASGHPPAFASDSRDRIVFWNRGAAELLGRRADEVLGLHCYEAIGGRDVFGNRFCYANCSVIATLREGGPVCGFEMSFPRQAACAANGNGNGHPVAAPADPAKDRMMANVTILRIPSVRPDLFTVVHILQPVDAGSRFARALDKAGALPVSAPSATAPSPITVGVATPAGNGAPPLTRRETEILRLVAEGLQNKEIAQKLTLSLATVRNHIHNILDKLEVHSKLEAVSLAFKSGWVGREAGAQA